MAERQTQLEERPISGQSLQGVPSSSINKKTAAGDAARSIANLFIAAQQDDATERRAIRQSYNTARRLDIEANVTKIIGESPNDGDRISQKVEAWKSGYLEGLPDDMRAEDSARIGKLANVGIAQANANLRVIEKDQFEANDQLEQGNFLAGHKAVNRDFYNPDPQISGAAREQAEVLEFDFKTRLTNDAVAPDGTIRISPKVAQKRVQNFDDITMSERIFGAFLTAPSQAKFYSEMLQGGFDVEILKPGTTIEDGIAEEDIRVVKAMHLLSPDAQTELRARINRVMKDNNDAADILEKEEDEGKELTKELTAIDNDLQIETPNPNKPPVTPTSIRAQVESGLLDGKTGRAQIKELNKDDKVETDPDWYNGVTAMIADGDDASNAINEGSLNEQLNFRDVGRLRAQNSAALNRGLSKLEVEVNTIVKDLKKNVKDEISVSSPRRIVARRMKADLGIRQSRANREIVDRIISLKEEMPLDNFEDVEAFRDRVESVREGMVKRHRFREGAVPVPLPSTVPVLPVRDFKPAEIKKGYSTLMEQKLNGTITSQEFNKQAELYEGLMDAREALGFFFDSGEN